jgi:hypothetical protein
VSSVVPSVVASGEVSSMLATSAPLPLAPPPPHAASDPIVMAAASAAQCFLMASDGDGPGLRGR